MVLLGVLLFGGLGAAPVEAVHADRFHVRTDLDSVRALAHFLPGGGDLGTEALEDIATGLSRLGQEGRRIEGETLSFLPGRGLLWGDGPREESPSPPRSQTGGASSVTPSQPEPTPCADPSTVLLDLDLAVSDARRRTLARGLKDRVSPGLLNHLLRFQAIVCEREAVLTTTFTEAGAAGAAENVAEGLIAFVSGQLQAWGPGLARILARQGLFEESTRARIQQILASPQTRQWLEALDPQVVGDRLILILRP